MKILFEIVFVLSVQVIFVSCNSGFVAEEIPSKKVTSSSPKYNNPGTGGGTGSGGGGPIVVSRPGVPSPVDLSQATVYDSPADVASWPVTTKITKISFTSAGIQVDFDKKDGPNRWPDMPFGYPGDSLQYTIWLIVNINGHLYTSGPIEYWYGLPSAGGDVTQGNQIAVNWFYDSRWGALQGYQPAPGEKVGFMVTAGNARNVLDHSQSIIERSNVVVLSFPNAGGGSYSF